MTTTSKLLTELLAPLDSRNATYSIVETKTSHVLDYLAGGNLADIANDSGWSFDTCLNSLQCAVSIGVAEESYFIIRIVK